MKIKTAFLFTLLIMAFGANAQTKEKGNNKSLLWRISGNKLAKPSYLFGTMHLICQDDFIWTDKMKECLGKSEKVCFEMNLGDPGLMMQTAGMMIDQSGKKLKDYFSADQYKILGKYLKDSLGLNISLFEQMKPVALESVLTTNEANCPNPVSYEDTIMKMVEKDHKEIMGLEEPKEQLDALESIPVDSLIKDLMDEIEHPGNNDSDYRQLINAYRQQDLPVLFNLINNSKELGDNMSVFLDDRNAKWISRMSAKMEKSTVFFAVGAGHLYGDKGVISLLRKKGFVVEPVK